MPPARTALVIGGGIGGLATALSLRQAGWTPRVFERASVVQEVGAGIALWSNGLRALDRLGVGAEVRRRGRLHDGGAIRSDSGRVLMNLSLPDPEMGGQWMGCMIHRADLLSALAEAVGPDAIRTGAEVREVRQDASGVTAVFADGSTESGDLLIGADGIRSAVRTALFGDVPLRYAGYTVWRWVAPFPTDRAVSGETWGSGARFGHLALPGERVYAYATADASPGGKGAAGEIPELRRLFSGWHAPIADVIAAAEEGQVLRHDCYDIRPLERWSVGRCALLGDAAHAMTPNLGQGACQALEDAVILGRWLGQEPDVTAALREYEKERLPRTTRYQNQSWTAGAMGQWSRPLAVAFRNFAARHVFSRLQGLQMKELNRVTL